MSALRDLYGPWALILGASNGVGEAFARQAASQGLNCLLVARNAANLGSMARELSESHDVEAVAITADLSDPTAFDTIREATGGRQVGLLVANAGADPNGSHFLDAPLGEWEALVQVNVGTKLACCHHFGKAMRQRGKGGIILIGSGACYGGAPFMASYAGVKGFTLNFAEGLWHELRPYGVDVLYMALGQTDTPAFRKLLQSKGQAVPENLASPDAVATLGLDRLPYGPLLNWGLDDEDRGHLPMSAAERRARVDMIARASAGVFEQK